jgi:iron complex transport system ATP-binding protein
VQAVKLDVSKLSCGYGEKIIVREISFSAANSDIVCLLGPNGVGKTTFYRTLLGFIRPLGGTVYIDGVDIGKMTQLEVATKIAYVPQSVQMSFAFTAEEVVLMGRNVHIGALSSPSRHDREIAARSMSSLGISHLARKEYNRLSGGERQMVLIARALTQESRLLIMDEPTSSLDYGNQIRILEQIRELKSTGMGIIMTTHSPEQALLCATRVIVFHKGALSETGHPNAVITEPLMHNIYGVQVKINDLLDVAGNPIKVCVPHLRNRTHKFRMMKQE